MKKIWSSENSAVKKNRIHEVESQSEQQSNENIEEDEKNGSKIKAGEKDEKSN